MPKQPNRTLPFPKHWPRRARSAAVHAIALARLALITARGQAKVDNPVSRCTDRLTEEVLLLTEDLRLKDARMRRIPAQRRPFCWWVAVVVDHFSRRIMGFAVFTQNPTSLAIRQLFGRAIREAGQAPDHLITDQGTQFTDKGFRRWCQRRGIRQRVGATGNCGSISVVERLIRTMKAEALRRILVPLDRGAFRHEVSLFVEWYTTVIDRTAPCRQPRPMKSTSTRRRRHERHGANPDDDGQGVLHAPARRLQPAVGVANGSRWS